MPELHPLNLHVHPDAKTASQELAQEIAACIRERANQGQRCVLGLATGSSPLPLYAELVRLHQEDNLSFGNVVTFNLDEYCGLSPDSPLSYFDFMQKNLFSHIDIPAEQTHIPNGLLGKEEIAAHCQQYEQHIEDEGGIDFQILGIGRTGHIGFNEPPSGLNSKTRLVVLDEITRQDAVSDFGGIENVPSQAITMGIATIMKARRIVLMAWGCKKAEIIQKALTSPPSPNIPASFLKTHPQASFLLDTTAAALLTPADS